MKLGASEQAAVRSLFESLERDVSLELELGRAATPVTVIAGGRELDFGAETLSLLDSVAALSDRVLLTVSETDELGRYPRITIGGKLRYDGLPWGHELATLIYGIAEAGRLEPTLSADSLDALETLERDIALEVFVTPT